MSESVSDLSYSLDGSRNVTFTDDVIVARIYGKDNYYFEFSDISEGSQYLTIYAKDVAGHEGDSETFFFIVSPLNSTPSPSPEVITSFSSPPPSLSSLPGSNPTTIMDQPIDATPTLILCGVLAAAVALILLS